MSNEKRNEIAYANQNWAAAVIARKQQISVPFQKFFRQWINRRVQPLTIDEVLAPTSNDNYCRRTNDVDGAALVIANNHETKVTIFQHRSVTSSRSSSSFLKRITSNTTSMSTTNINQFNFRLIHDAILWNAEELYCEVVYEIVHNIGFETDRIQRLLNYLQDSFKMSAVQHKRLLEKAENREPPEVLLNVEVVTARGLIAKDANGYCDPFVTIFLASNASYRYNTSVKKATLNPIWEEHFALPVTELKLEDTLCVEVWDFDPAETVREKVGKFLDVKNIRSLRKLVKEIAITATTGQHKNELIGKCFIPLKTITSNGLAIWCNLNKKNKSIKQGILKLKLNFCSEKNIKVAIQEYKYLLRTFLLYELESSKVKENWWCENFNSEAETILKNHCRQSNLSDWHVTVAKWSVYCTVHTDYQLSWMLFVTLQEKIEKFMENKSHLLENCNNKNNNGNAHGDDNDDDSDNQALAYRKEIWDSASKLMPSCLQLIKRLHGWRRETGLKLTTVRQVLTVLGNFQRLDVHKTECADLLANGVFGERHSGCTNLKELVISIIKNETVDWFESNIHRAYIQKTDTEKIRHIINYVQLIKDNLQNAIENLDSIFLNSLNFYYSKVLYILYDERIAKFSENEIISITKNLQFRKIDSEDLKSEKFEIGTVLFELYLLLQKFSVLGMGLCPNDYETFYCQQFNLWFHDCVIDWLNIAVQKALSHIEKAVDLDLLTSAVDANTKYSSSAVDTIAIFYQIKIFWHQLNWPEAEDCYSFVTKIIDDICRCCVFYSDKMVQKLNAFETENKFVVDNKFTVTTEWCFAINNIDYVRQSLMPFISELGMDQIINKLAASRSQIEADHCRQTLISVAENSIDTLRNKIIDVIETMIKKMSPFMNRFLIEGAELLHRNCNSVDRLMTYLDNNLETLYNSLNEDNFDRVLAIVWDQLEHMVTKILNINIEKRRPPTFFQNLHESLKIMVDAFHQNSNENDVLKKIEPFLIRNSLTTSELIHRVFLERWQQQQKQQQQQSDQQTSNKFNSKYGYLAVKVGFDHDGLLVHILNARNLPQMDFNQSCDAFVKISLSPADRILNISRFRTQTQHKTLFPIFEEVFKFSLTKSEQSLEDGLVIFTVKDKDMFMLRNQYVGDVFVRFSEISNRSLSGEQMLLPITRPTKRSEYLPILEQRTNDKVAKDFLKKYKTRCE